MEQGGIYKLTLVENRGLQLNYNSNNEINSIAGNGRLITIQYCQSPNFKFQRVIGLSKLSLREYSIMFREFDYDDIELLLSRLETYFGYFPVIYYLNGAIQFIESPMKITNEPTFESNATHFIPIEMKTEVDSIEMIKKVATDVVFGESLTVDTTLITVDSSLITSDQTIY
jgi:hypothetical protein